jgi:hypothetical protein
MEGIDGSRAREVPVPRRRRRGGVEFGTMETTRACGCARGFMLAACGRAGCVVAATARDGG